MRYLFYFVVFFIIGIVIGIIFHNNKVKAYIVIIIITTVWGFIWKYWAIATFIELIIGYSIAELDNKE